MALLPMKLPPVVSARMKQFLADWNDARAGELQSRRGRPRLTAPHPLYRYHDQRVVLQTLKQREPDGWRAFVHSARGEVAMLECLRGDSGWSVRLHTGGLPERLLANIHRSRGAKRLAGPGVYAMGTLISPAMHRSWIWFSGDADHVRGERWLSAEEWEATTG
jgi:hypothetical protein